MTERKIAGRRQDRRKKGRVRTKVGSRNENLEELHLRMSEYHRAHCDTSYLRNLTANLPPDRDGAEEGRAGWGLGRKGKGGRHRGRRWQEQG